MSAHPSPVAAAQLAQHVSVEQSNAAVTPQTPPTHLDSAPVADKQI